MTYRTRDGYVWRESSGSGAAEAAGVGMVVLSVLAYLIGALHFLAALVRYGDSGTSSFVVFHGLVGTVWIVIGALGVAVARRISDGGPLAWGLGFAAGIAVMFLTWGSVPLFLGQPGFELGLGLLLDVIAFFAAAFMTLLLVVAAVESAGDR